MQNSDTPRKPLISGRAAGAAAALVLLVIISAGLFIYSGNRMRPEPEPVSPAEEAFALSVYRRENAAQSPAYRDAPELSPWSWKTGAETISETAEAARARINAGSAILVDAATGSVLLEKNADKRIPPASMTKLVAMYTAFHAIENGEISLDDLVDLPPESWAVNIPPGSSLMFLGRGQRVTVRELLEGMAVVSGNDAAIALAYHISGSVPGFVDRMNEEVKKLGLTQTFFTEPSGLSEENVTTPREFADFSLVYIRDYPEALPEFHSLTDFSYPRNWNLPPGTYTAPVRQQATNRLLGLLPGCDGLKTGYIDESGYNLALTCSRGGSRFISVTMNGPGNGSAEGNKYRIRDGSLLMEWAFDTFTTVHPGEVTPFPVPVWEGSLNSLILLPAGTSSFTAPSDRQNLSAIETVVFTPVTAPVYAGQELGRVNYYIDGEIVKSLPLVADRNIRSAGFVKRIFDRLVRAIAGE
ncbi:D-alanyl-D-alanine carboxypeptidase [Brucepastera parasyntrophica]|uniref:D-alanyl-D-alanine carboxypeptidase family protein n=1 Tax=Brucepastera parasyntrophica TaxID=2880008 RepID=UPI00210BA02A|nr:D-alanyl-D-alanine carboxypeptidase family protein [Brucepastera parasyntrophica]ULQ59426.1 D-alanyl-D-alanine carboxypeptidase [Brucepastera parasyntrophica]